MEEKEGFERFVEGVLRKVSKYLPLRREDFQRVFESYSGYYYEFAKGRVRRSSLLAKGVLEVIDAEDRVWLPGDVCAVVRCTRVHARGSGYNAILYIDVHGVRIAPPGAQGGERVEAPEAPQPAPEAPPPEPRVFGSELLEKVLELSLDDPRAFADLEDVFSALRDPDFDTEYSYELGVALSGRVRAALRGEADEYERWVRREGVLERALVLMFKEYVKAREAGAGLKDVYGLRRYLDRVAAAFEALSRLAARGDLKRLYADLAALADRLAGFAYALDTDSFFEALNTAVERGLAHPLALHVELLRLEDDRLRERFYEAWKRERLGLVLWGFEVVEGQAGGGDGA
jgi:hypothetical protein